MLFTFQFSLQWCALLQCEQVCEWHVGTAWYSCSAVLDIFDCSLTAVTERDTTPFQVFLMFTLMLGMWTSCSYPPWLGSKQKILLYLCHKIMWTTCSENLMLTACCRHSCISCCSCFSDAVCTYLYWSSILTFGLCPYHLMPLEAKCNLLHHVNADSLHVAFWWTFLQWERQNTLCPPVNTSWMSL